MGLTYDPEDTSNEIDTDEVIKIKFGENDLTSERNNYDIELTNEKKSKEETVASEDTCNENDTDKVIEMKFEENEGTNAVIHETNNDDAEIKCEGYVSENTFENKYNSIENVNEICNYEKNANEIHPVDNIDGFIEDIILECIFSSNVKEFEKQASADLTLEVKNDDLELINQENVQNLCDSTEVTANMKKMSESVKTIDEKDKYNIDKKASNGLGDEVSNNEEKYEESTI